MLCTLAFLRAAGLLAVGFSFASATTLIAIWSPQRLLIGADSRVISNIPNVLGNACKIEQTGSTYYAFNGLVADKTAGYNIESLAREAVQGTGDLSAHMRSEERRVGKECRSRWASDLEQREARKRC